MRGAVEITGVTTRTNTSPDRVCLACLGTITIGQAYERVMRTNGDVESYGVVCFEREFGTRSNYGG